MMYLVILILALIASRLLGRMEYSAYDEYCKLECYTQSSCCKQD